MKLENIRKLVGDATPEQLRYVDCYVGEDAAVFMPAAGVCFYSLTPAHAHPAYMFVLPFNDRTVLRISGRDIRSRPGGLMALAPGLEHHELPADAPPRYIAIFIDRDFFEKRLSDYPLKKGIAFRGEYYGPGPDLLPLLKKFMAEAEGGLPGSEDVLRSLSAEICHSIIRSMLRLAPPAERVSSRIEIDRAVEYVHANMGSRITLNDMARAANMSTSHFARVFKKEAGLTPVEYLNDVRMERVRKLLRAGGRSITDIALACGFGSPAYLSERFQRKYGLTPSEYRDSLEKGFISKKDEKIAKDPRSPESG